MYYVLYADSDERSRQMACGYRFWQESGFCLKAETGSGEEALNLLKKDYFDLVITDLRMMAGEGILLAEAMKRQGCTASLVLSGSLCSFESAREGMRLGALDFIPKPVTERKLSEALEGIEPELRKRKIRAGSFRKETVEQAEIEALYREILSGQMENEVLEGWIKRLLETLGKESGQEEAGRRGAALLCELWIRVCRDFPWIELLDAGEWLKWRSWFLPGRKGMEEAAVCLRRMIGMVRAFRLNQADETVNRILEDMARNLGRGDCLDMTADELELSRDYVRVLFKKRMGMGQNEYLTMMRMEYAKHLLKTTNLKVYQVAKRVGYSTIDYFSRLFKAYSGMTPARYRKDG